MSVLAASDRMSSSAHPSAGPRKTIVLTNEWRRYTKTRDRRARDQLILAYSPIVKYAAGRLIVGMPSHVELADLISYGLGGLIQAVERFEPSRGIAFESFAYTRIRGAIVDGLRTMDWVPRRIREEARLVAMTQATLTTRLQRAPTDKELAKQLKMEAAELDATLKRISDTHIAALDQVGSDSAENGMATAMIDSLTDPHAIDPDESAQADDLRTRIAAAIELLPERERVVVGLRYTQELSLGEIGDILGVSESRACQIHTVATRRLRGMLEG